MNLGPDPVQGKRHQANAAFRIEAAHRLHQADIAFLDQIGLREPVAEVIAADGDDQPQVGQDERAGRFQIVVALQLAAELGLLLSGQQRETVHRLDIVIQTPQRSRGRESQRVRGHR